MEAHVVGFLVYSLVYQLSSGAQKEVRVAIWYPADTTSVQTVKYSYVSGKVAVGAPPLNGNWPLVVYSHGMLECGVSAAYLTQSIAASGYIVAAPDHEDASNCLIGGGTASAPGWDLTKSLLENFPNRPSDLAAVISHMVRLDGDPSSLFLGRIDESRIVLSGHSLGGWTAASVSGAMPPGLSAPEAVLLWSPSARLNAEVYQLTAPPVMYLFGEYDSSYTSDTYRTWAYDQSRLPKYLAYVGSSGHYGFTDKQCRFYGTVDKCLARNAAAQTIWRISSAFLRLYVLDSTSAGATLDKDDPGLVFREYAK